MKMFGARRWCFTTSVLFMLCPTSYCLDPAFRKYLASPRSKPARWAMEVVRDMGSDAAAMGETEPGFDYTPDEIFKLRIWPGGVIPYYIDEFSFDKVLRDRVRSFLEATNHITGLNFIELNRPPEDDNERWVFFLNRQGVLNCVDHPYKTFSIYGVQKVVVGYDCLSTGAELAEVVLALVGVPPQHNAPDRDRFVAIKESNIIPDKKDFFEVLQDNEWLFHKLDYDYYSASHYPLHKYTVNGMATIQPTHAKDFAIGEAKGFSYTDIHKIRMVYNFLTKKRLNAVNIPECNKLFDIGSNTSNYQSRTLTLIIPGKKPNRYLGLPDEPSEASVQNDTNVSEIMTPSKEKVDKPLDSDEEKTENSNDVDAAVNVADKSQKHSTKLTNTNNSKEKLVKLHAGNDGNRLLQFSDYETDSDGDKNRKNHNVALKFTKPGGKLRTSD